MSLMQSSRLPSFPALYSSFPKHKGDIEGQRLGDYLTNPAPIWGSLPSPPMSGSPPPDERTQPQQIVGHRRKRSDSPPATTAAAVAASGTAPPLHLERRPSVHQDEPLPGVAGIQPSPYPEAYPPGQQYRYGLGPISVAGPSAASDLRYASAQISPRPTRKTKAHVASACVNCKKKHLRCDHARPCNRCVVWGKESTCFDVEHKKRGRPPLKPEDSASRRSYDAVSSPRPGLPSDPSRRLPPASAPSFQPPPPPYHRDIRPIQTSHARDLIRPILRPGPMAQSMYAPPTVSPSIASATGTMTSSSRYFPSEASSASTQSQTPYMASSAGYSPVGADGMPRSLSYHMGSYPYQQVQPALSQSSQPPYPYGYPRGAGAPITPSDGPSGMYDSPSLRLPPIRPATQGSYVEPAMAQRQRQAQYQPQVQAHHGPLPTQQEPSHNDDDGTRQPDQKRPRMDIEGILGPKHD